MNSKPAFRAPEIHSPRPHAARRYTTAAPREPRYSNPRRGDWSRYAPLSMTHADEGGCRAPGTHAISTRTAHTTTTSSIHRVPKTVGRIPGSTLPSAIATGRGIYQSTSLPAITTLGAINIALPTPLNGDTAVLEAEGGVVFCVLLGAELPRPATRCERSAMPKLSHAWHAASVMCAAFHAL